MKKRSLTFLLITLCAAFLFGCSKDVKVQNNAEITSSTASAESAKVETGTASGTIKENPTVTMEIKGYGTIEWELYPDIAPNTVYNIISLIKKGFYDNNTIHRVYAGFVVQGGDPNGNGTGGPGYTIKGEFTANGFQNDLKHERGVLSMARRSGNNDSAGSQFFICLDTARTAQLDGQYATFGRVTSGMDIIDRIVENEEVVDNNGKLKNNLTIVKATVNTKGVTYPEPEIIK